MPLDESRAFKPVNIALITVSDSRTFETDSSGDLLADFIVEAGHKLVDRVIERDDMSRLVARLHTLIDDEKVDCVILTGGTGLTGRDITPEALDRVKNKDIPGFGELFRMLSWEEIGTSTLQSRALGGLANTTFIFCLPGSTGACRTGWDRILQAQLDARTQSCNLVELLPRLREGWEGSGGHAVA